MGQFRTKILKMYPPKGGRKPRKKPVTRSRASGEMWNVMDRIAAEMESRHLSQREVARRIGQASATRVGAYLKHQIIPGPDVLRRLCLAVGISPIDAFWQAKYFDAVFDDFESFYRLGWSWMREDRVHLDPWRGAAFDAQHWGLEREDHSGVPPLYAHRYHQAPIYNRVGTRLRVVALPKPMAYAFLLAIGLFVRRGDQLRPYAKELVILLSVIANRVLPQAQLARAPSGATIRKPFKEAARILPRGYNSRFTRLALVAEHVQSWCDMICMGYADYARLALYKQGGFVGKPERTNMYDEDIWKWQHTDPISIDDLRITKA
ncbi:MAG TPA: helix-turn-helix transcriptional regulator [Candidatus Cybelea sp.]|nr:helix-turn-helix transcriptional regulator [Candidatus Cybelea sp.]